MSDQTVNTVEDNTGLNLRAMAEALDAGQSVDFKAEPTPAPSPAVDTKESASPQQPTTPKDSKVGTDAEPGKPETAPTEETTVPKTQPNPDEGKPDSKFVKAQKEKERLNKTWETVNAEKERIAADKAELAKQQAEIEKARAEMQRTQQQPNDPLAKFSDDELIAAAKEWEESGDTKLADRARGVVSERRIYQKAQADIAARSKGDQEQFMQHWEHYKAYAIQQNPDLQNPESELYKETAGILQDKTYGKILNSTPMGVQAAVEVVKLRRQAASVPALEKQVVDLKAEVERLNKLSAVPKTPPNGGPAPAKNFEEMPLEEQGAYLRRAAAEADGSA